jgi:serine protease Do
VRGEAVLITAGHLDDGRAFFTRSDRTAEGWATLFMASGPDEAGLMALMRASLRPGAPEPWSLPDGGRLDGLVRDTLGLFDAAEAGAAPEDVRLTDDRATTASGTGFYVSDRVLVTAHHVVGGCAAVGLADGSELTLIAADAELDLAVLAGPGRSAAWLPLTPAAPARLGQRVHAMGFPYYGIAGTAMHLTGGNVSALAGVDDDRRFFSFTAPVQPGSSGGPLIGARGDVLGVVVSRLSDSYIAEATGTLPQNVNYALGNSELVAFLARAGVIPAGRHRGFDLDVEGVPPSLTEAVVPVLCR